MTETTSLHDGESLESALKRFKRKVLQEDIIKETKRHAFYLKPPWRQALKRGMEMIRHSLSLFVVTLGMPWTASAQGRPPDPAALIAAQRDAMVSLGARNGYSIRR
jgi:small subunit ribosomal protein S21